VLARSVVTAALLLTATAGGPAALHPQAAKRDLITRQEIEKSAKVNDDIYQLIRSLRPHFLAPPRGIRTFGGAVRQAVLYVNGTRHGELASLKNIRAMDVQEVRYLDPTKAEEEYGITHNGGAVLVTMVRSGKP